MTVRIAVAGAGAFGNKHLDALAAIDDAEVVAIVDPVEAAARKVADARGIPDVAVELWQDWDDDSTFELYRTTLTVAGGFYEFGGLANGKYKVVIPSSNFTKDDPHAPESSRALRQHRAVRQKRCRPAALARNR